MRTKVGVTGGHQQLWLTTDSDGWPPRLGKLVGDGGWVAKSGHGGRDSINKFWIRIKTVYKK